MDQKTSLLINKQVPEFVREEYPLFISFLEAYYQFLENEQFTNGTSQQNDLTTKAKDLRYVADIDYSLDQFQQEFFDTFIPLLPKDTAVSKDFLIKNILPLYQSKGTEKSFQFFFRLLFGEEIAIEYPRNQILRASDGQWSIENILKTENAIYSQYVSDGVLREYYLPYEINSSQVEVHVNGVLKEEITDYLFRKESKKVVFNNPVTANSIVKLVYIGTFDISIFNNRQITGLTSGTNTIVEKVGRRNVGGLNFLQFFINSRNITSQFNNGELVKLDVVVDGRLLNFYLQTISDVDTISIVNPGSSYNVGDTLTFKGQASKQAIGIVDRISSGLLENLRVKVGSFGAGYKVGNNVFANNISTNNFISFIDIVDTTGFSSPNTIAFNTDLISSYANVSIGANNYGFPSTIVPTENVTTVLSNAFSFITVTGLGPAVNVIISSSGGLRPNALPTFQANSSIITGNTRVSDLGSIGTIKIISGGEGYRIGDNLIFTNTEYFSGQGAAARVSAISPLTGGITRITVTNGGYNYRDDFPPTITVNSNTGRFANVAIQSFMGEGAQFEYDAGDGIPGKILSVNLLDKGSAYTSTPLIDLKKSGDGNALVTAQTQPSYVTLPGRWLTSDSILSSDEIKLEGENYYIDFSYIISSQIEFQKYKNVVKDLMNPSGMVNYARYSIVDNINSLMEVTANSKFTKQITGTVNVASGSGNVFGSNTYFTLANTLGILAEGSYITVNSELMVVNSIINNTHLTVAESYLYNANDQLISTMNDYDTITTETWIETKIESNSRIFITTEDKEQ
jgi:hypothetical protein